MWSLAAQNPHVYFDLGVYHCVKSSGGFLVRGNIVVYQEKASQEDERTKIIQPAVQKLLLGKLMS